MIDLHSHTTASDGQHPPEVLIDLASKAGITTLAVTDHDTVASVAACTAAATARGMRLVPGIEVSIMLNGREVHVLGHFVDPSEARLASFSENLRDEREKRMVAMVEKLRGLGFPITMQQVVDLAGPGAHLARPHLARVLMELNYVANTKEAFDRFLGDGKAASVPRFEVTGRQAIELIHGAGGTATVAHPGVSKIHELELKELAALGLDGLEVEHSDHAPTMREKLRGWADSLSLIATAGSDFHGAEVAPNRHLGTASMKPEAFAALEARRP